jgi:hypothetical protein
VPPRTNQDLNGTPEFVPDIEERGLELLGHTPEGGRHRLRSLEDEESDLRELIMNIWRQNE